MNELYTIGQFSKLGRVSTKMLRHYDKIGLLKPSEISPETGYRYYHSNQIKDILMICRLKTYRFSLDEIKQVMSCRDLHFLHELIHAKHTELIHEIETSRMLLDELGKQMDDISRGVDIMNNTRTYDIGVKEVQAIKVLSKRDTISMEQISSLVGRVYEAIFKAGLKPAGSVMTFYYVQEDFDPTHADVEVCVPVDRESSLQDIPTKIVPAGLYAFTTFIGPYHEISGAYAAMGEWLHKGEYEVSGAPYEKYITNPAEGMPPSEYVTELYFPIRKK